MARSHGRILASIWAPGSDFLSLDVGSQRMFMFLLSQPDLSQAGLIALRVRRWAASAGDLDADAVRLHLKGLEDARYIVIDEDTEELLVRTFVRGDGVYKQPKVMVRMAEDARQIMSPRLRAVFSAELGRLPLDELTGEQEATARQVVATLTRMFDVLLAKHVDTLSETPSDTHPGTLPDRPADTPGDGYGIPPSRARTRSPLPPTPNHQTKNTSPTAADATAGALLIEPPTSGPTFDAFWTVYPRRVGKQDAQRAWAKAVKKVRPALIVEGAQRYASDPNLQDPEFRPYPATWLTRGGWDDEPCPQRADRPSANGTSNGRQQAEPQADAAFWSSRPHEEAAP